MGEPQTAKEKGDGKIYHESKFEQGDQDSEKAAGIEKEKQKGGKIGEDGNIPKEDNEIDKAGTKYSNGSCKGCIARLKTKICNQYRFCMNKKGKKRCINKASGDRLGRSATLDDSMSLLINILAF